MIFVCCYCFLTISRLLYVCGIEDLKSGLNFSRSSGSDLRLGQGKGNSQWVHSGVMGDARFNSW